MRWRGMRSWATLLGPLFCVLVLTVGPTALRAAKLSWPAWILPTLAAAGGVLLLIATPLLQARLEPLIQRIKRQGEQEQQQQTALTPLVGSGRELPRVRDVRDRRRLGIHPAIPLPSGADAALSAELPTYVPRDVDADLRAALRAASMSGGFLLLVGRAASGKTRCAYEAINTVLGNWRLAMPATAERLTAVVDSGADLTRTVVWLNETQKFLGTGQLTAETVLRLLADPTRPVVIVGTMWPQHLDRLRAVVRSEDGQDVNQDSREILALARQLSLPEQFSNAEQARAQGLAEADPRISEALRYMGHEGLTEVLAAAPELISRWEQAADPYGAAVIGAALDARRCGHPEPLPAHLLEILCAEHLTGLLKATATEEWFTRAVEWACEPVRGSAAPLTPDAARIGQLDGYRVSDILVQHAQRCAERDGSAVLTSQWILLIDHASPEACADIGDVAYFTEENLQLAERAWRRAAEAGDTDAMHNMGVITSDQGKIDEALAWWQRAANAGHAPSMFNLGNRLRVQGNLDQTRTWWQQAAQAGNANAMNGLGSLSQAQGEVNEARAWYQQAAQAGDTDAMSNLGALLYVQGDVDQARTLWQQAAEAGNPNALTGLGALLYAQGDVDQARTLWQQAAEAGNDEAIYNLGVLLATQGDVDQARIRYQEAAEAGYAPAMNSIGVLLHQQGELAQARIWWQQAAEAGNTDAMIGLGALLHDLGEVDEARTWWQQAAEAGDTDAMNNLGVLLKEQGEVDAARTWYQRAAEAGNTDAMNGLGVLLHDLGEVDAARTWYQRAAEAGNTDAMNNLAAYFRDQGEVGQARTWWQQAAETGDTNAMNKLGILLHEQGDADPARSWWQQAAEAGDADAMNNLGVLAYEQEDMDQACTWFQRAAEAGNTGAMDNLSQLRRDLQNLDP